MISLPTPTKPQTLAVLTDSQRSRVVELIAERWLDGMDFRDLEQFFRDTQVEYLKEWMDSELLEEVGDFADEDELNELLAE